MIANCERAPLRHGILMVLTVLAFGLVTLSSTKPSSLATESSAASFDLAALEPVDRLGGHTTAVAISGTRAAVGVGRRVALVDLSEAEELALLDHGPIVGEPSPSVLTEWVLDVAVHDLLWHENTVVAAVGARGLAVVDASARSAARVTGRIPTASPAWRVAAGPGEARMLAATRDALLVLEWATGEGQHPAVPREIGRWQSDAPLVDVKLVGERAYLAAGEAGVIVIDLADPARPRELGRVALGDGAVARSVVLRGGYAFVAAQSGLHVIELNDPDPPRYIGVRDGQNTAGLLWAGDELLAFSGVELRSFVLDASGWPRFRRVYYEEYWVEAAAVAGDQLLLAQIGHGLALRRRGPEGNPAWVPAASLAFPIGASQLLVDSGRLLVAGGGTGLFAFEFGERDRFGSPLWQVPGLQDTKRMAVAGQRVLVAGSGGLQIIDAPIEGPPRIIAEHAWGLTQDVATLGELAVLLLDRELAVFNLSDPEHPNEIGRIALQGQTYNLRIVDEVAYVMVGSQLHAISLADPSRPRPIGVLEQPAEPGTGGIMTFEPVAARYLAASIVEFGARPRDYLAMLDARDPSRMAVRGVLDLPNLASSMAVTDETILMGSAEGLLSVDPRQPDLPDQNASLSLPEPISPTALLVDGARLIVAGSGLTLLAPRGEPGRVWLPLVGRGVW